MEIDCPKCKHWYWKTGEDYTLVTHDEIHHTPIIKLLTETYGLIGDQYVRYIDMIDPRHREMMYKELEDILCLLR